MKNIALLIVGALLYGCMAHIPQTRLEVIENGRVVRVSESVRIIETRPPFNIKLEWQLLPGNYVERYRSPQGPVFVSEGPYVRSISSLGENRDRLGGFIVTDEKAGTGTLFSIRGSGVEVTSGFLIDKATGVAGDFTLVTTFPLSSIKNSGW